MKKIAMMIAALVMTLSANAQFEQGKMYVGASMTGFDASYSGATEFHLGIDAKAGYFFMDNLMAYGQVGYKHYGQEAIPDYFTAGIGARYYIVQNGIFLGASGKYIHASSSYNDFMPGVEVGYAFFINRTVTIEPAIYYDQSFKKHSDYSTVGFRIGIGINLFQNTPSYFR
jgi:hypothetical protein